MNQAETEDLKGVDRLLKSFFDAEKPKEWPAFEAPRPIIRPAMAVPQRSASFSKASLAIAAALLIGACWLLSGMAGGPGASRPEKGAIENGTAKVPNELKPPMK